MTKKFINKKNVFLRLNYKFKQILIQDLLTFKRWGGVKVGVH